MDRNEYQGKAGTRLFPRRRGRPYGFEVLRQAVCVNELIYEGSVEQSVDSDLTLPDYCPDILRILKCTVTPRVTGSQVSGERITVDGTVLVRLIYVGEDGTGSLL